MIHPLIRKELREHLWVLCAMWVLCALALLGQLVVASDDGSPMVAYQRLVGFFGVLMSLALANRLVVREYGGRTQLFLETLPMGRAQVIAIKWLTGAACLLAPMAAVFGLTLLTAADQVELTGRFVLSMALRGATFLLFFYSLAFAVGLTGRYRYLLWLAMVMLGVLAAGVWQLPFLQWPPVKLVAGPMAFQRDSIPVPQLLITGAATVALVAASFALALGFQGSWVVALSRRMSLREKVLSGAVFLSLMFVVVMVDQRKPKQRFELQDAVVSGPGLPQVSVARAEGATEEEAFSLAQRVATDLRDVSEFLALESLPAVAVLPDASLDADLFMLATLPDSDGVVVRGAFGADHFDESAFRAYTIARVLDWHSRGRATREERRWLLDGFAWWQVAKQDAAQRELLALRAAVALQAVEAGKASLAEALDHWLTTGEQLGDCVGDALAWRTTEWLAQSLGEERFRGFARKLLGVRSHGDIRDYFAEESLDQLLKAAGAPAGAALATDVWQAMQSEQAQFADTIRSAKRWPVSFDAVQMRGSTYEVRFNVAPLDGETPPLFAVRYARISPWESEVPRTRLERVDATTSGVLPTSFARGARVFTAVEMSSPQLACTVRLGASRWEVK